MDDIVCVSENSIIEATKLLFETTRMVVEPSGALGLAAILSGAYSFHGPIGIIVSGGNIDKSLMIQILGQEIGHAI